MNIFEELDKILNESTEEQKAENVVKSIPINPDMETKDQGIQKALEKMAKYFYNLSVGGGGANQPLMASDEMDLPDDFIDPKLKGKISGKMQDKEFDKNKVLWDPEEEMEKMKKEVELNADGDSDDEFDDFDYRDNQFGDDDVDDDDLDTSDAEGGGSGSGSDSDKSEEEKLKDAINDAINQLKDDKSNSSGQSGDSGEQSGQEGGQQSGQEGGQEGGQSGQQSSGQSGDSGEQSGNQSGEQSGQQSSGQSGDSGEQSGQEGGQQSGQKDGQDGGGASRSGGVGTSKDQKLKELQDALNNGDMDKASKTFDGLKDGDSGSGQLAGENLGEVSSDAFKNDMQKAGMSDKDIKEMDNMQSTNTTKDISPEAMRDMQKHIVDELNKKCKKKGGSALSTTIVKNAMQAKIEDSDWKQLLKLFLKGKSVMSGDMGKAKNGIKYGHKNHLWRGAVLPTKTNGHGEIQNIYCFVDFSGSVNQDLVFTFLGKVIDLCYSLNYTKIFVYGVGDTMTLPREITSKMLKTHGKDVVLSQTWDFIDKQIPGAGSTQFLPVAQEIMEIRRKERDAIFLVFGDAQWSQYETYPLKNICGPKILKNLCMLLYYMSNSYESFSIDVAVLKELIGIENIITSKASSIHK